MRTKCEVPSNAKDMFSPYVCAPYAICIHMQKRGGASYNQRTNHGVKREEIPGWKFKDRRPENERNTNEYVQTTNGYIQGFTG